MIDKSACRLVLAAAARARPDQLLAGRTNGIHVRGGACAGTTDPAIKTNKKPVPYKTTQNTVAGTGGGDLARVICGGEVQMLDLPAAHQPKLTNLANDREVAV